MAIKWRTLFLLGKCSGNTQSGPELFSYLIVFYLAWEYEKKFNVGWKGTGKERIKTLVVVLEFWIWTRKRNAKGLLSFEKTSLHKKIKHKMFF